MRSASNVHEDKRNQADSYFLSKENIFLKNHYLLNFFLNRQSNSPSPTIKQHLELLCKTLFDEFSVTGHFEIYASYQVGK